MVERTAIFLREVDPRLKLASALVLGPCLWKVHVMSAVGCALVLLALVAMLSASRPVGGRMIKGLLFFVFLWVAVKAVLDAVTGVPPEFIALDVGQLAVRLAGLALLGLWLALSTSPRSMGLAVAWFLRPVLGRDRAWRVALALALMVHFLPVCLTTVMGMRDAFDRRCPDGGGLMRARILPQAVIRHLGQKTWNQTLAVASRGLEGPDAWRPDFHWSLRDSLSTVGVLAGLALLFLPSIGVY